MKKQRFMEMIYSWSFLITCLAGIQWGMIGIGGFLNKNLNMVSILAKGNTTIEYGTYCVIGIITIIFIAISSIQD